LEPQLFSVHFVWTAAAAVLSWTPDADYLVRFITSSSNVAVGYVNATLASLITPSQVRRDLLFLANGSANNSAPTQHEVNRVIFANETLYVSQPAVVGALTLYLQLIEPKPSPG
jgi:hypothetical protein